MLSMGFNLHVIADSADVGEFLMIQAARREAIARWEDRRLANSDSLANLLQHQDPYVRQASAQTLSVDQSPARTAETSHWRPR